MCHGCWEEAGKPQIVNDKTLQAADAVEALYMWHPSGGGMHIVTDDWNCEDQDVEWCKRHMAEEGCDQYERDCLDAFLACTEEERYSALAIESGFFDWRAVVGRLTPR